MQARSATSILHQCTRLGRPRCFTRSTPQASKFAGSNWDGRAQLNLDEALYLAKEAGYWTKREVQLQIVRSPPFSSREKPFILENFFELADRDKDTALGDDSEEEEDELVDAEPEVQVNPVIHNTIQKYFRPNQPAKFVHSGEEWLSKAEGRGTRKRASAHVVIQRGSGVFKVNGESNMYAWWPQLFNRFDVCQPFKLTGTAGVYDVFAEVQGGGASGQAGAARLAIARALLDANPACHDRLQEGFCLLEDTRQRVSKRPGRAKARASFAWNKR